MDLKDNQSALILETSEEGEISVNIASPDPNGLSGALCHAIAMKLMEDLEFQEELMGMLEEGDGE